MMISPKAKQERTFAALVTPFSLCKEYKDPSTARMNFDLHTCKNIGTHCEIIDWTFICKYVQQFNTS